MKNLKRFLLVPLLILSIMGAISPQAMAHTGVHYMEISEALVHFLSSPFHMGVPIAFGLLVLAIKTYRLTQQKDKNRNG